MAYFIPDQFGNEELKHWLELHILRNGQHSLSDRTLNSKL